MEIKKWKRRRYVPTWGGNQEEEDPCVVVFSPPTVGWMVSWREIVMEAPLRAIEATEAEGDGLAPVGPLKAWSDRVGSFREGLLKDLILAVENLTEDGRQMSIETALAFINDNEGLREELFNAILKAGQVDSASGKD